MIAWKDGKVDRHEWSTGGGRYRTQEKQPGRRELANALDECVAALLKMREVYLAAPADDAARLLMLVRDECLRKIGVEP